jgi:hypothetical protein
LLIASATAQQAQPTQAALASPVLASPVDVLHFLDLDSALEACHEAMLNGQPELLRGIQGSEVTTLFQRFNQVDAAEWQHDAIGLGGPRSDFYYEALRRGWISEIAEPDGSTSYQYAVCNAALAPILNDDGMVLIGDTLYQYTDQEIKQCTYSGPASIASLLDSLSSNTEVTVEAVEGPFSFSPGIGSDAHTLQQTGSNLVPSCQTEGLPGSPLSAELLSPTALAIKTATGAFRCSPTTPKGITLPALSGYNWSNGGSWKYWDNNKKRAKLAIVGYSSASGTSVQAITFNVNVRVERKNIWGNWVSGAFTCCYLYSSWMYKFGLAWNDVPFQCKTFYSPSLATSPVTYSYSQNYWPSINNLIIPLAPSGTLTTGASGYDYFCDAVRVFQYSFSGSVCGGSSGISLNPLTL